MNFGKEFFDDWDSILANDYSFHFYWLDKLVPLVRSDIADLEPLLWVSVQDLLDQVLRRLRYETRYQVVAVYDFLVQLACVRVFERQVAAHHGVEDDAAAPDVRVQALVPLASDHLGRCVAGTTTSRFEGVALVVGVR